MRAGGGHEQGMRSGTENVPAIVGFGAAAALAAGRRAEYALHTERLRTRLDAGALNLATDMLFADVWADTAQTGITVTWDESSNEAVAKLAGMSFEETGEMPAAEWGETFGPFDEERRRLRSRRRSRFSRTRFHGTRIRRGP